MFSTTFKSFIILPFTVFNHIQVLYNLAIYCFRFIGFCFYLCNFYSFLQNFFSKWQQYQIKGMTLKLNSPIKFTFPYAQVLQPFLNQMESTMHEMKSAATSPSLNLEVFVTILRACHPLFPITHAATTKNNLLDSKISAAISDRGQSQLLFQNN